MVAWMDVTSVVHWAALSVVVKVVVMVALMAVVMVAWMGVTSVVHSAAS